MTLFSLSRRYSHTEPKESLPVSLLGLSPREEAYVRSQVEITLKTDPMTITSKAAPPEDFRKLLKIANGKRGYMERNSMLMSKCLAIPESFDMKESDKLTFMVMCYSECFLKVKGYATNTFIPTLVQRMLTYQDIDPDSFTIFKKCKGQFDKVEKEITNSKTFKTNYREKLDETIDRLGLHELEPFTAGLDENADFSEFSETFYQKIIGDNCGISNLKAVDGIDLEPGKVATARNFDPINLVRNFYIFEQILNLDLDISLTNLSHLTAHCSLDLLVSLNLLHALVRPHCDVSQRTELLSTHGNACLDLSLQDQKMWCFPLAHALKILHRIGFTQEERELLLFRRNYNLVASELYYYSVRHHMDNCNVDFQSFTETMEKRLMIIRQEGVNLGVVDVLQMYQFMMNWEKVMSVLSSSSHFNSDYPSPVVLQFKTILSNIGSCTVTVTGVSGSHHWASNNGTITFLKNKFDYNTLEETVALLAEMKKIPHFQNIPLKVVVETAMYLEQEGFTTKQMDVGFHVMFYSRTIVHKYMKEAEKTLGTDWREQENALCLLLYVIELATNFSFCQLYDGIAASSNEDCRLEDEDDDLVEEDADEDTDDFVSAF